MRFFSTLFGNVSTEKLLGKEAAAGVIEADLRNYENWRAECDRAVESGSQESIRVVTAIEQARGRRTAKSAKSMKKKSAEDLNDDVRPHYDFDFKKMKPNPYAGMDLQFKRTFVTLDEDVSKVFQSSEDVNTVLRSAIKAMRTGEAETTRQALAQTEDLLIAECVRTTGT